MNSKRYKSKPWATRCLSVALQLMAAVNKLWWVARETAHLGVCLDRLGVKASTVVSTEWQLWITSKAWDAEHWALTRAEGHH